MVSSASPALPGFQALELRARDGLPLQGYLTVPKDSSGKGLPLVLLPHGGPTGKTDDYFDDIAAALASRGFIIIAPNFRGSTGYGKAFWQASFKQWGKTMQDDISDGVHKMVKDGVADPKQRLFRYGVQVNSLGLTEQQPENNVYRILLEMLAVVMSKNARARSVQLPAWNEALGLPRPWDQQWSLRMQQILAYETDLLEYEDLFDGSHVVGAKTEALKDEARAMLAKLDAPDAPLPPALLLLSRRAESPVQDAECVDPMTH